MANWDILKQAIANAIKTNGNQEITGAVLQNTLNSIVNSIGENATFVGIATPTTNPGTPDGPVFYIATQKGAYSNFNNIAILENEIAIIFNKNNNWLKSTAFDFNNLALELIKCIRGTSDSSSAYTDPFLFIGNFTTAKEFNVYLDAKITQDSDSIIKHEGRCKALINGINVEVYNFVSSIANKNITQVVFGSVDIDSSGSIKMNIPNSDNSNFNIIIRCFINGVATKWSLYYETELSTKIPTAQADYTSNTNAKEYIYSSGTDFGTTVVTASSGLVMQSTGDLLLRFQFWNPQNKSGKYISHTFPVANLTQNGLMSARDKTNLDLLTDNVRDLGNFASEEDALNALSDLSVCANGEIALVHLTYGNGNMSINMIQCIENDYCRQILFNKSKVFQRAIYFANAERTIISYKEDWSFLFGDRLKWNSVECKYVLSQFENSFNTNVSDPIPLAGIKMAGLMSAADKVKLDGIEKGTELIKRIRGTSDSSSAMTDPFLQLGEFKSEQDFNNYLDNNIFVDTSTLQKHLGRCRATINGINVEIQNFVLNYEQMKGSQVVSGSVKITDNGRIGINPDVADIPYRIITRGVSAGDKAQWKYFVSPQ